MTAAIILAAGGSSRLGQPKQNLLFNNKTLLQHAVDAAQQSKCHLIIVVLGANADQIDPIPYAVTLYNKDWEEGMASSIKIGINKVGRDVSVNRVIIMLCDQPYVTAGLLNSMIDKQIETGKPIVACTYNGTMGVPVLFDRFLFAELLLLLGQEGAKKIIITHADKVAAVPFERGDIDIDTPADYEQLRKLSE
ncbi:MAG: NTP transferase domain-containing protein [Sphingobacteriales bacterium]